MTASLISAPSCCLYVVELKILLSECSILWSFRFSFAVSLTRVKPKCPSLWCSALAAFNRAEMFPCKGRLLEPKPRYISDIPSFPATRASRPVDVEMLEMKIHENKRISSYSAEGVSIPCSVALRHVYYYACLIHLKRTLRKLPLSGIQDLVEQIIHVLGTAEQAKDDLDCTMPGEVAQMPYPVWPIFIAAYETGDNIERQILLGWLSKGRLFGLGNMPTAALIVEEVWTRRKQELGADIYWYDVMVDLTLMFFCCKSSKNNRTQDHSWSIH